MRFKCICSYKGTKFDGWQYQQSGGSVQNHIENALSQIFSEKIRIHGCSRTDAGVHAKGQCFHFDAVWEHSLEKLLRAIHSLLDKEIRINKIIKVNKNFHARFSAKKKQYTYSIHLGRTHPFEEDFFWSCRETTIDLNSMIKASKLLIGTHNFQAFSAVNSNDKDPNPIKTIESIKINQVGKKIYIHFIGTSFLYKMVRSIAGTLYAVSRKRLCMDEVAQMLKSKQRTNKIITAPAKGLALKKIYYK